MLMNFLFFIHSFHLNVSFELMTDAELFCVIGYVLLNVYRSACYLLVEPRDFLNMFVEDAAAVPTGC